MRQLTRGDHEALIGAFDVAEIMGTIYGPGFMAKREAFSRPFVEALREDLDALLLRALATPDGTVPRGPNRLYVETYPEALRGFVDLVSHPWVVAVCRAILGPGYRLVEVGFDVPGPGAADQPWHRDFPAPAATRVERRLDSLAFNVTAVDTTDEMGPFEIAPGTQWDELADCPGGMFPPPSMYPRYQARAQRKLPKMGDLSARSALTLHRGTANRSSQSRPVLVLGFDAPDARNGERHDLQMTRSYHAALPAWLRPHLACRLVDVLEPIVQAHQIPQLRGY